MATINMNTFRDVERIIKGQATSDGDGVKLTRLLTQDLQHRLDPFLMLDAFGSDEATDYVGGFPDHPHRGFETVTYMLKGRMRHHDSAGNTGLLEDGGVQWMTAGKGVIHSEMPEQKEGRMSGFQLWLNLPSHQKMCAPWYKDIQRDDVPEKTLPNGVMIRVIAGESQNTLGAIQREVTQPLFLDVHFPGDGSTSSFEQFIPSGHNAFLYVYHGSISVIGGSKTQSVLSKEMAILSSEAENVALTADLETKLILISGAPLRENIVQYGPFVMNTKEEIIKAVEDFRNGQFA